MPQILLVPAVMGLALLVLPLVTLVARVNWSTLWADISSPEAVAALLLSLGTGLATTLVCVVLGVPLALVIARSSARLAGVLRALITVPLVLPPMVGGIALLYLFGRTSWLGGVLGEWGIRVPFSTSAVVLAQTFVALPFLVLAVEGSLRSTGVGYEETAAGLGASRWTILRRVTLPLAAPSPAAVSS